MDQTPAIATEVSFEWGALVPQLVHPLRVAIVEALLWIGAPMSASDLNKVLDGRVGVANLSYHVRELAKKGALEPVGQRHVRGAVENFYFLSEEMVVPSVDRPKAA